MTFEQAFKKIQEKFVDADASNVEDFAMQITLTDEDCGGTLYAAVKNGILAVEPYDYKDNTSVLDISKSALLAVLSSRSSLDKVIDSGEASIKGEASNVAALKSTIKKTPKTETKAEVKPAAKTEVKSAPKATAKAEAKPEPKKSVAKAEAKPVVKTEAKAEVKPAATSKNATKAAPKKTVTSKKKGK